MATVWRLIKSRYARSAFTGDGARRYGGRWNSPGTAVAYAADSAALAVLEVLVHVQSTKVLGSYSLVGAEVPTELVETLPVPALPHDWTRSPAPRDVRAIGDAWVQSARSAVLKVPSAVVGPAYNYLLNPAHPDFAKVTIGKPHRFAFDARLIDLLSGR